MAKIKGEKTINDFINYMKSLQMSKNTIEGYTIDIKQFLKQRNKKPEIIQHKDVVNFIQWMSKKKKSPATIRRKIHSLQSFYKFLINVQESITKDPTYNIKVPKLPQRLPKYLTYNEILSVLERAAADKTYEGKRDRAILELLYFFPRESEILNLNVKDLDLINKKFKVIAKGNKEIIRPFGGKAKEALEEWLKVRFAPNTQALFVHQCKRLTKYKLLAIVEKRTKFLGKHITPHTFRHTAAVHMLQNGASIRAVQEAIGHKNIQTTMIYTQLTQGDVLKTIENTHPRA